MSALYERIDEIGTGGIGTVYKGVQTRLNRPIAIKEIRDIFNVFADVNRDAIVEQLTQIVQTQATLAHTNIVQILDIVSDEEYPYVVMQYAPNGNLRRLIDMDGLPPIGVALKYFLQLLHALHTAHEQGVIHGSLKPENVLLDTAGNALLSDFGISKVVDRSDNSRNSQVYVGVGTVAYMSPEQFQAPGTASVQCDIYALGIMLYEMLTGTLPGRRSPMPSNFNAQIPKALDDIFDRMCMDMPSARYNTVKEIFDDIYASSEIVGLLDRVSGVLFIEDPITHGGDYKQHAAVVEQPHQPIDEPGLEAVAAAVVSPAPAADEVANSIEEPVVEAAVAAEFPAQLQEELAHPLEVDAVEVVAPIVVDDEPDSDPVAAGDDDTNNAAIMLDDSDADDEPVVDLEHAVEQPEDDSDILDLHEDSDDSDISEESELSEESEDSDVSDISDDDSTEVAGADLLDKLNKYGALFEEEN